MDPSILDRIHQINYLYDEVDALYHQAALRLGLTDSAMLVLYHLHDHGGDCPLRDIYHRSGASKQTVHSAIGGLERDGHVVLEQEGKRKRVRLTERGVRYAEETVGRLVRAEAAVYAAWAPEEMAEYVRLTERYVEGFRRQLDTLDGEAAR